MTNAKPTDFWLRQFLDSNRKQNSGKRSPGVTRMRAGQICCACTAPLPVPHTMGIKRCERCQLPPTRRVLMSFMHRNGWHCRFLEWDMMTPLPRQLKYRDSEKVLETAQRGHGLLNEASRLALDHAIKIGHGEIWLNLTDEQYQRLKGNKAVSGNGKQGDA